MPWLTFIAFWITMVILDRLGSGLLIAIGSGMAVGGVVEYGMRKARTNTPSTARLREGMAARLGDVIYWAAALIAATIAGLIAYAAVFGGGKGEPFMQVFFLIVAGLIWLFGRACRYVLTNR
jgi:hypothetical protein